MRLSTVEQPVRKEAISAANPKQSLRDINDCNIYSEHRFARQVCRLQFSTEAACIRASAQSMFHLFSNATDLKAAAVFRAHTRQRKQPDTHSLIFRQRFGPRPDVAGIAPGNPPRCLNTPYPTYTRSETLRRRYFVHHH